MFKTNRLWVGWALCIVAAAAAHAQAPAGPGEAVAESIRSSVDEAVARVTPALVRIHVVFTEYAEGRELKYESHGSGVIVTKEGHVVTNHHVAGHAARAFCTLVTKEEIEAELVGSDPLTDIAVLKLIAEKGREFPTAAFGDSAAVAVGETVLAMGCPMALSQSVTVGVVSNTEMIMPDWMRAYGGMEQDGEDVGALVKWIGHDADIAGGNSGGPLVNLAGEIVGINELRMALGGAIPSNVAQSVAETIIQDGEVVRAWLGMRIQPLLKHSGQKTGALVSSVIAGSPADAAGLKSGDVLTNLAGQPVTVAFSEQLPEFNGVAAGLEIGKGVPLTVLREGAEVALTVTPEKRERVQPKEHELKEWGITARDLSLMLAKEMKRDNRDGVLVTSVRSGGGAGDAKPRIQQGDVIVELAGKPVRNIAELAEATRGIVQEGGDPVPVLTVFERQTERLLTVVKVGMRKHEDPGLEVKKAWLPVETQVISRDIAELLGNSDLKGFRVTHVYDGSTAESAGLAVGDLILAVDGEKLTASAPEQYEELPALIRQYKVGTSPELTILRDGEEKVIPVELVLAPKLEREMKEYTDEYFEFTVRNITFFDRAREQWEEGQRGVRVSEVRPGGWAMLGRLNVGDLIIEVDGQETEDVEGFEAVMKGIAEAKPKSMVLKVLRGIYTLYLELEPKWDDAS